MTRLIKRIAVVSLVLAAVASVPESVEADSFCAPTGACTIGCTIYPDTGPPRDYVITTC